MATAFPPAAAIRALRGSRCGACTTTTYPQADTCPRCGSAAEPVELSGEGTLWTWTVQRFAPKSPPYVPPPGGFAPFVLGYVELPEGLRVAAVLNLDVDDLDWLAIGSVVRIGAEVGPDGAANAVPRGELT